MKRLFIRLANALSGFGKMTKAEIFRLLVGMAAAGMVTFMVFGFKRCFPDVVGRYEREQEKVDERIDKSLKTVALEITDALSGVPIANCEVGAFDESTELNTQLSRPAQGLYIISFLVHHDSLSATVRCVAPGYLQEYKQIQIPRKQESTPFPQQIVLLPRPPG